MNARALERLGAPAAIDAREALAVVSLVMIEHDVRGDGRDVLVHLLIPRGDVQAVPL